MLVLICSLFSSFSSLRYDRSLETENKQPPRQKKKGWKEKKQLFKNTSESFPAVDAQRVA